MVMVGNLRLTAAVVAVLVVSVPAAAGKECTCRHFNQRVEIGAVACVNGKLAQCLMFQNNPSWKIIGETCPQTRNDTKPLKPGAKAKLAAR
jgi:hypothetical protein